MIFKTIAKNQLFGFCSKWAIFQDLNKKNSISFWYFADECNKNRQKKLTIATVIAEMRPSGNVLSLPAAAEGNFTSDSIVEIVIGD